MRQGSKVIYISMSTNTYDDSLEGSNSKDSDYFKADEREMHDYSTGARQVNESRDDTNIFSRSRSYENNSDQIPSLMYSSESDPANVSLEDEVLNRKAAIGDMSHKNDCGNMVSEPGTVSLRIIEEHVDMFMLVKDSQSGDIDKESILSTGTGTLILLKPALWIDEDDYKIGLPFNQSATYTVPETQMQISNLDPIDSTSKAKLTEIMVFSDSISREHTNACMIYDDAESRHVVQSQIEGIDDVKKKDNDDKCMNTNRANNTIEILDDIMIVETRSMFVTNSFLLCDDTATGTNLSSPVSNETAGTNYDNFMNTADIECDELFVNNYVLPHRDAILFPAVFSNMSNETCHDVIIKNVNESELQIVAPENELSIVLPFSVQDNDLDDQGTKCLTNTNVESGIVILDAHDLVELSASAVSEFPIDTPDDLKYELFIDSDSHDNDVDASTYVQIPEYSSMDLHPLARNDGECDYGIEEPRDSFTVVKNKSIDHESDNTLVFPDFDEEFACGKNNNSNNVVSIHDDLPAVAIEGDTYKSIDHRKESEYEKAPAFIVLVVEDDVENNGEDVSIRENIGHLNLDATSNMITQILDDIKYDTTVEDTLKHENTSNASIVVLVIESEGAVSDAVSNEPAPALFSSKEIDTDFVNDKNDLKRSSADVKLRDIHHNDNDQVCIDADNVDNNHSNVIEPLEFHEAGCKEMNAQEYDDSDHTFINVLIRENVDIHHSDITESQEFYEVGYKEVSKDEFDAVDQTDTNELYHDECSMADSPSDQLFQGDNDSNNLIKIENEVGLNLEFESIFSEAVTSSILVKNEHEVSAIDEPLCGSNEKLSSVDNDSATIDKYAVSMYEEQKSVSMENEVFLDNIVVVMSATEGKLFGANQTTLTEERTVSTFDRYDVLNDGTIKIVTSEEKTLTSEEKTLNSIENHPCDVIHAASSSDAQTVTTSHHDESLSRVKFVSFENIFCNPIALLSPKKQVVPLSSPARERKKMYPTGPRSPCMSKLSPPTKVSNVDNLPSMSYVSKSSSSKSSLGSSYSGSTTDKYDEIVMNRPVTPRRSSCSSGKVTDSLKTHVLPCSEKFQPRIFLHSDGCERCLSLLSEQELTSYYQNGNSPLVTVTSGGCHENCQFSPGIAGTGTSAGLRLCRRCFQYLHKPLSDMLKVKNDEGICDRSRSASVSCSTPSPMRSRSQGRSISRGRGVNILE